MNKKLKKNKFDRNAASIKNKKPIDMEQKNESINFNISILEPYIQDIKDIQTQISEQLNEVKYLNFEYKQKNENFKSDLIRKVSEETEFSKSEEIKILLNEQFEKNVAANYKFIENLKTDNEKQINSLEIVINKLRSENIKKDETIKKLNHLIVEKVSNERNNIKNTISFQLGYILLHSFKSINNFISLPSDLLKIRRLAKERRKNAKLKANTSLLINKSQSNCINLSRGLTLLDPISELCWSDAFTGYPIVRTAYNEQISSSTCKFAFFESAWQANKGTWLYAFTSPGLKHANAQALLAAIQLLKDKNIPVIFWNKEDPMHYEMFKPIAQHADYIFTTDILTVEKYKKELNNSNVWAMPFAAPIKITNPIGRFELDTGTVCFAGTYYAQNHENRQKQMDMLLPALLSNNGCIYDRASKDQSGKYAYPEQYKHLIKDGVNFDEMVKLYKKFKIFLNVNTITQSTTMMSRRVYELLASGTPVISTPSKAITEQFPGIVITVNTEQEADLAVKKLLTDSYYWHKQSVIGIREVMTKHTYENRWEYAQSVINNNEIRPKEQTVRIVALYHNYLELNSYLDSLLMQNLVNIKEIILLKSSSLTIDENIIQVFKNKVKVFNLSEFKLNEYLKVAEEAEYTFFTSDNVINYKKSIYGLISTLNYCKTDAVSRSLYYKLSKIYKTMDYAIDKADWYKAFAETTRECCLIRSDKLGEYSVDIVTNKIKSKNGNKNIFLTDPFNVLHIDDKKLIQTKQSLNQLIYKSSPYLGV